MEFFHIHGCARTMTRCTGLNPTFCDVCVSPTTWNVKGTAVLRHMGNKGIAIIMAVETGSNCRCNGCITLIGYSVTGIQNVIPGLTLTIWASFIIPRIARIVGCSVRGNQRIRRDPFRTIGGADMTLGAVADITRERYLAPVKGICISTPYADELVGTVRGCVDAMDHVLEDVAGYRPNQRVCAKHFNGIEAALIVITGISQKISIIKGPA
jgi:hypothetical protein